MKNVFSHFCQSMKMNLKEKSIHLTIQGWTCLREDCGIAVGKHFSTIDVRITHPTSQSYSDKSLFHRSTNSMKKKKQVILTKEWLTLTEKSSFNPFVFITSGGMTPHCTKVDKRLAEKCRKPHASVITYIRTKLRFAPLRSILFAIWGFWGKQSSRISQTLTSV